jgi:hypothetical protein
MFLDFTTPLKILHWCSDRSTGASRRSSWPSAKALKALRAIAKRRELGHCDQCSKLLWPTRDAADQRVEEVKTAGTDKKPYLLNSYRCPHEDGWHFGDIYKLGLPISWCIGECK